VKRRVEEERVKYYVSMIPLGPIGIGAMAIYVETTVVPNIMRELDNYKGKIDGL